MLKFPFLEEKYSGDEGENCVHSFNKSETFSHEEERVNAQNKFGEY